jgi:hypothetical protein
MTIKKTKSKASAKKAAKKSKPEKRKKEFNPAEVRRDIAQMVDSQAARMTQAVIDEGMKGQLATVKYLFEVAEIYPASTDGSYATREEESLAQTLLRRLDLPDEPIGRDEEDEPKEATPADKPNGTPTDEDEPSGSEPKSGEAKKDPLVA